MAVISVNEMAVPSPLTFGKESNTYTRQYKVVVDISGMQGAIQAATASDSATGDAVDKIGDPLIETESFETLGNTAYCTNISPSLQYCNNFRISVCNLT